MEHTLPHSLTSLETNTSLNYRLDNAELDHASWLAELRIRDAQIAMLEAAQADLEFAKFQLQAQLESKTSELEIMRAQLYEMHCKAEFEQGAMATTRNQLQQQLLAVEAEKGSGYWGVLGDFVVAAAPGATVQATHELDPHSAIVGRPLSPGEVLDVMAVERYRMDCSDIGALRGRVSLSAVAGDERLRAGSDLHGWVTLADPHGRCGLIPRAKPQERPRWRPGARVEAVEPRTGQFRHGVAVQPLMVGGLVLLSRLLDSSAVSHEYVGQTGTIMSLEDAEGRARCYIRFSDGAVHGLCLEELAYGGETRLLTLSPPSRSSSGSPRKSQAGSARGSPRRGQNAVGPVDYHVRWDDPFEPDCVRAPEEMRHLDKACDSSWGFLGFLGSTAA